MRAAARLACVLLLALVLLPSAAQIPGLAPAPAASAPAVHDVLDRGTPRRAVTAFARAARRGDLPLAVNYVQAGGRPQARLQTLVRELGELMDRHFHQSLGTISDSPDGALDDGLPLDRERIGPLRVGGQAYYLELVRVTDPTAGPIWLISSETLGRVGALREEDVETWPERMLPAALFTPAIFDFTFADLTVWAASLALPLLLLPPLVRLGRLLARRALPSRADAIQAWYHATRWPVILVLALAIHLASIPWYGPTLSFRIVYGRVIVVLLVALVAWALHRAFTVLFGRAGAHLRDRGLAGARSAMLLGERLLNVLLLLVAVLTVMALVGFDLKTVLAGLGIIGVALALGAQKTIENILGGMMLLGDEAIAVGDLCRVNNRLGTVEDITLRSVRFRTSDNTLLSIPAGVLAQAELENFASRDRILMQHRLRLAYDTTAQQLHRIREELAEVIENHPGLEHPLSRVRLVEFGTLGFELEIYANILTRDVPQSLATREELLLRAVTAVDGAGARFVQPLATVADPPR